MNEDEADVRQRRAGLIEGSFDPPALDVHGFGVELIRA
jgi:hypothetical protein